MYYMRFVYTLHVLYGCISNKRPLHHIYSDGIPVFYMLSYLDSLPWRRWNMDTEIFAIMIRINMAAILKSGVILSKSLYNIIFSFPLNH